MEGLQAYGASDSESDKEASGFHSNTIPAAVNAAPDVASSACPLGSTAQPAAAAGQQPSRPGVSDDQLQSRWQTAAALSRMVAKRAAPETSGNRHATNTKAAKLSSTSRPSPPTKGAMLPPQLRGRSNVVTEDLERIGLRKSKPAA